MFQSNLCFSWSAGPFIHSQLLMPDYQYSNILAYISDDMPQFEVVWVYAYLRTLVSSCWQSSLGSTESSLHPCFSVKPGTDRRKSKNFMNPFSLIKSRMFYFDSPQSILKSLRDRKKGDIQRETLLDAFLLLLCPEKLSLWCLSEHPLQWSYCLWLSHPLKNWTTLHWVLKTDTIGWNLPSDTSFHILVFLLWIEAELIWPS